MKILVTGARGQLGHDVVKQARLRRHEVIETDIAKIEEACYVKMDIANADETMDVITHFKPDAIIHCAAWTKVDQAEDNPTLVFEVNSNGTLNVARAASEVDAKVLYLSTDYVFDGQGEKPWKPDETRICPLNVYGDSKRRGEVALMKVLEKYFIVRISWVFGKHGSNFVHTMLNVAHSMPEGHNEVRVVDDQIGNPTYTKDLARLLLDMIETDKYGIYHACNEGRSTSWYEFCKEIYRQASIDVEVVPVHTFEYTGTKAKRPFNSRLDRNKLADNGFKLLPDWHDALADYLKENPMIWRP